MSRVSERAEAGDHKRGRTIPPAYTSASPARRTCGSCCPPDEPSRERESIEKRGPPTSEPDSCACGGGCGCVGDVGADGTSCRRRNTLARVTLALSARRTERLTGVLERVANLSASFTSFSPFACLFSVA